MSTKEIQPKEAIFSQGTIGADPELFLKRNGKVIGSEKVIRETELVVEDGVQVELHPRPDTCRERLAINLWACFAQLYTMMEGKRCKAVADITVDVTKNQYDSLKPKNKLFGCGRSYNAYDKLVTVNELNPAEYLKRSAGGHMHFGTQGLTQAEVTLLQTPDELIPLFDILVGNTAVMLDRDEGNIERRKHYGKAGEYRTPAYGVEYRTLSNFWLRSEPLMSLMFGLARHAIGIGATGQGDTLKSLVEMDDIIKAINTNDYELAKSNWDKIKDFIVATAQAGNSLFPITSDDDVRFFEQVASEGIDKWFSQDILSNWLERTPKHHYCHGGWQTFKGKVRFSEQTQKSQSTASTCTTSGGSGQVQTF